jgi:hypothetical protein
MVETRRLTGHGRLLLALFVCEAIVLSVLSVRPPSPLLFGPLYLAFAFLAAGLVSKDASELNREKGSKLISPGLWSLLAFFLSFMVLPVYVFLWRRDALSLGTLRVSDASYRGRVGDETQRRRVLLGFLLLELVSFVLSPAMTSTLWVSVVTALIPLLGAAFVYTDARDLNHEKGFGLLNGAFWAVLSYFVGFIVLPLYIFLWRKEAIGTARNPAPGYDSQSGHEIRPVRRRYDMFLVGALGCVMIVDGVRLQVQPSSFQLPNVLPISFNAGLLESIVGTASSITGAILLVGAVAIFLRRKRVAAVI